MAWLAALAACGTTGDTTIDRTFDPCALAITASGTTTQMTGIADALALWRHAPPDGVATEIEVRFEQAAPAFHGYYDDERGLIYINQRIEEPRALAIVIAHELGHAFGLEHIDDRDSLMNSGNTMIEPTEDDLAEVTARWGACRAP